MANEAWCGIDVQLKRRSDLVPNLVDTVKGYAAHDRGVLEEMIQLRGAARALPSDDVARRARAEGALSAALGRLFDDLGELSRSQGERQFCRAAEAAQRYRKRAADGAPVPRRRSAPSECAGAVLPSVLIAALFGFGQRDFFEVAEAADCAVPQVDLTQAPR